MNLGWQPLLQKHLPFDQKVAQGTTRRSRRHRERPKVYPVVHGTDPRRSVYLPPPGMLASQFFGGIWR